MANVVYYAEYIVRGVGEPIAAVAVVYILYMKLPAQNTSKSDDENSVNFINLVYQFISIHAASSPIHHGRVYTEGERDTHAYGVGTRAEGVREAGEKASI